MRTLMGFLAASALLLGNTGEADASVATGIIRWVSLDFDSSGGNIVFVKMEVTPAAKPGCASNPNADYSFDASTVAGKNFYAFLLASYTAQREVKIGGYDTCSVNSSENLRWVAGT